MRIPGLLDLEDRRHQPVEVAALHSTDRHHRHAAHLRQQFLALLAQLGESAVLVLDEVPFVDRDDHGAALAFDQIGERQILLFEGDRGIEQQHHHFGVLDGAEGIADGELFELLLDASLTADAGGVDEVDDAAFPLPRHHDRVARDAGFRAGEQPLFADHAIDQRGFAGIGAADDGDVEVALGVPAQRRAVLGRAVVLREVDIDVGQLLVDRRRRGLGIDRLADDGVEIGKTQPMLGGERHCLAEAERIGLHQPRFRRPALGLVGDEVHFLAGFAQHLGEALVERRHPGPRVDHEEDHVSVADGDLGLLPHPILERAVGAVLVAGGIKDAEAQISDPTLGLATVARYARRIVDERNLPADEAVEQRGFADIGSADDSDDRTHNVGPWSAP